MERVKHHYCWVKAFRVEGPAPASGSVAMQASSPSWMTLNVPPFDQNTVGFSTHKMAAPAFGRPVIMSPIVPVPARHQPKAGADSAPNSPPVPVPAPQRLPDGVSPNPNVPVPAQPVPPNADGGATDKSLSSNSTPSASYGPSTPPPGPPPGGATQMQAPPLPSGEMMLAGATFMGAWQLENFAAGGDAGKDSGHVVFAWQPILGSRDAAMAWRASPAGQAWCRDALSLLLVAFVAVGEL